MYNAGSSSGCNSIDRRCWPFAPSISPRSELCVTASTPPLWDDNKTVTKLEYESTRADTGSNRQRPRNREIGKSKTKNKPRDARGLRRFACPKTPLQIFNEVYNNNVPIKLHQRKLSCSRRAFRASFEIYGGHVYTGDGRSKRLAVQRACDNWLHVLLAQQNIDERLAATGEESLAETRAGDHADGSSAWDLKARP